MCTVVNPDPSNPRRPVIVYAGPNAWGGRVLPIPDDGQIWFEPSGPRRIGAASPGPVTVTAVRPLAMAGVAVRSNPAATHQVATANPMILEPLTVLRTPRPPRRFPQ